MPRPTPPTRSLAAATIALLALVAPAASHAQSPPVPAENVVLDANSYWHAYLGFKTVELIGADGRLEPIYEIDKKGEKKPRAMSASTPPPSDWASVDFDDSVWPRTQGPFGLNAWCQSYTDLIGGGNPGEVNLICLRGKFRLDDPAGAGPIKLSVGYIGGLIAYLNGKELTRAHLPAGPLTFDTLAERYPDSAYLRPDGRLLNERADRKEQADRYEARIRRLTDLVLPADRLVRGVNVLAIGVHRAPISELRVTGKFGDVGWPSAPTPWPHAKVEDVKLVAPPGASVESARARPRGVRVWNRLTVEPTDSTDFGDPCDRLGPVRMVGPRNGVCHGQVIVSSDQPITGLSASAGPLRRVGTSGQIPASAVRIRYALPDGPPYQWYNAPPLLFDSLVDGPPDPVAITDKRGGAVVPVWLTVQIPADAAPGPYEGTVTVKADGLAPVELAVRLQVGGFRMVDAKQFTPHVGLIQSPESVALQYKVEMWSPRHWELLDKSFELLGQLGNKTLYVPLLRRTHFGNPHTMVRWIKTANGYSHDFSVFEKYLDLAVKHWGKPPVVALYCWERYAGQVYLGTTTSRPAGSGLLYTLLDPATGQLTEAEGPKYDDPEVVAFLKPVLDGIRERLAQRGLADSMMLGVVGDMRPLKPIVEVLKQIAPGTRWVCQAHPRTDNLYGVPTGYMTNVWPSDSPPDPQARRLYGWKSPAWIDATFPREGSKCIGPMRPWSSPALHRLINEAVLAAGMIGFGRTGADFWNVVQGRHGPGSLIASYPESDWAQLGVFHATSYLLGPGKDGPVATVRMELIREGLQLAEARVFLEKALTDPAARARLGEELAGRCQEVLDRRVRVIVRANKASMAGAARRNPYWWSFASSDWLARDQQLYDLAGEVAAKLAAQ